VIPSRLEEECSVAKRCGGHAARWGTCLVPGKGMYKFVGQSDWDKRPAPCDVLLGIELALEVCDSSLERTGGGGMALQGHCQCHPLATGSQLNVERQQISGDAEGTTLPGRGDERGGQHLQQRGGRRLHGPSCLRRVGPPNGMRAHRTMPMIVNPVRHTIGAGEHNGGHGGRGPTVARCVLQETGSHRHGCAGRETRRKGDTGSSVRRLDVRSVRCECSTDWNGRLTMRLLTRVRQILTRLLMSLTSSVRRCEEIRWDAAIRLR